jgi:hypothetical protein
MLSAKYGANDKFIDVLEEVKYRLLEDGYVLASNTIFGDPCYGSFKKLIITYENGKVIEIDENSTYTENNTSDLALVGIFKNESHIMKEWLDHYIKEGVSHFFLIDNGSTDNYQEILEPYIKKKIVDLVVDSKKHSQIQHYEKFLNKYKKYKWLIICDFDEFIYARNGFNKITDYLNTLDSDISKVSVPWKIYGSNGFIRQPHEVIKSFNKRCIYNGKINPSMPDNKLVFCKSIVRTNRLINFDIHDSTVSYGLTISSDGGQNIYGVHSMINETILEKSYLHLNHYAIQSKEWFNNIKATRGDVNSEIYDNFRNNEYFNRYDTNDIIDDELSNKIYK